MSKLRVVESIDIEASTDRVWIALISAAGFQHWCAVFAPNSYFEGDWSEGSTMRFLARSESGEVGGMVSRVVEHVPHAVIRIEHIGVVKNGIDTFGGDDFELWVPSVEEYRLGGRTLTVVMEVPSRYHASFASRWKQALAKIKELAEA